MFFCLGSFQQYVVQVNMPGRKKNNFVFMFNLFKVFWFWGFVDGFKNPTKDLFRAF